MPRAVGLEGDHLAVGARDRGAGRARKTLTDRAARERQQRVARRARGERRDSARPLVAASSTTIAPSGWSAAIAWPSARRIERLRSAARGVAARGRTRARACAPSRVGQRLERAHDVVARRREHWLVRAVRARAGSRRPR